MSEQAPHHYGYIQRKDDYLARLKRVEGQVRGVARMVDEEQYCIDILTQISATTKALHAVSVGLLGEHLSHCVVNADAHDDMTMSEKVSEAVAAIERLVRS